MQSYPPWSLCFIYQLKFDVLEYYVSERRSFHPCCC